MGDDTARQTAKALGWALARGPFLPCVSCSVSKACQKNVPQVSTHVWSVVPGEQLPRFMWDRTGKQGHTEVLVVACG